MLMIQQVSLYDICRFWEKVIPCWSLIQIKSNIDINRSFLLMYTCVQRDISMIVSLKIYAFVKIKDQRKLSRWRQLSIRFTLTSALKSFHVDVSSQFVSRWHKLSNSFTLTSALKSFHVYNSSQILSRWRQISNHFTLTSDLKSFHADVTSQILSRLRQLLNPFRVTPALKFDDVDVSFQVFSRWRQLSNASLWHQLSNHFTLTSALKSFHVDVSFIIHLLDLSFTIFTLTSNTITHDFQTVLPSFLVLLTY